MLPKVLYLTFCLSIVTSLLLLAVSFQFGHNHPSESTALLKRNSNDSHKLRYILKCNDKILKKNVEYHGDYVIFKNFIKAEKEHACDESITLSAPADYRFLDNVEPLLERWNGPISVALYAPGYDFFSSLSTIAYLRKCSSARDLIKKYVSFHLFCEHQYLPSQVGPLIDAYKDDFNCKEKPPYEVMKDEEMYKSRQNLTYPINMARNIAKVNTQTHFVFPSDIELYPTRNFISKFLEFIKRNPSYAEDGSRNVYVLPVFEIFEGNQIPNNKTELQEMFKKKTVILFHKIVCSLCHRIPNDTQWMKQEESEGLDVFVSAKRHGRYRVWEPFFICTQEEPLWDERFNWEGQNNKMVQAYHLCMLDYNFIVMNNAFLVHKPGVKKKKIQNVKYIDQKSKNTAIIKSVQQELTKLYGVNKNCVTIYKSQVKKKV